MLRASRTPVQTEGSARVTMQRGGRPTKASSFGDVEVKEPAARRP